MTNNKFVAIVDQIPVDQTARATRETLRFLLKKAKLIQERRNTIEEAAKRQQRKKILDEYKKAIGFSKMKKTMDDLEERLKKAKENIIAAGLTVDGELIDLKDKQPTVDGDIMIWLQGGYVTITKEIADKIQQVVDLIKAVEGEIEPFALVDQLETRMMMSSTVGEAMAVVNALVGVEVFRIDFKTLGISPSGQKQLKDKETK
jgi:uncharacterized glyoxalase superfamily protein PhnB